MKYIPLAPKAPTTDLSGQVKITPDKPFRIVAIDRAPDGDLVVTVYGDATDLGDRITVSPKDFDIPDALQIAVVSTWLKDEPVQSSAGNISPWERLSEDDFVVGELQPDEDNHWCIKIEGKKRYIFKPHADVMTAVITEAQQGDEFINKAGLDIIKEFEGFEPKAYADAIHGWEVPTIGYGTTKYPNGNKVKQGDTINEADAEEYLIAHIAEECKEPLEDIPTWDQMSPNQQAAIYSFAYNLGSGFYGMHPDFTSMTKVCDSPDKWGDKGWITAQFVKYRNPGSPAEAGLKRRRIAEAELFCS